jgi:hypothetical protein
MATVPGTLDPLAVAFSVNVVSVPAGAELIVAGFIGCVKVAVTNVPVTTLPVPLVLVGTLVALLLGFEEATVGSVAEAPGVPTAPGITVALAPEPVPSPPPPPHPLSKADSSIAINQPQFVVGLLIVELCLKSLIFISI